MHDKNWVAFRENMILKAIHKNVGDDIHVIYF